ncbi:hypothetical protein H6F67_24845 [Microcoleus sp. FACHB-1515]|uniref:hypothetical protein n=1 Tax=Cyanophyceae TaxID=3028117 RepID=UPI00168471DE|nr:hypothetical protein [Microcoleus sp. FACHB-1515]MBD2093078.1 hypothetical protein [Microcoleus sp. FACHB-1515]
MTISRIVLDADTRSTVDAIQEKTRSTSPSAAIALMVSRYGRHLLETWEVCPARCPEPPPERYLPSAADSPVPAAAPTPQSASTDFSFSESIEL